LLHQYSVVITLINTDQASTQTSTRHLRFTNTQSKNSYTHLSLLRIKITPDLITIIKLRKIRVSQSPRQSLISWGLDLPPFHALQFRLQLKGKTLYNADTLSRAPLPETADKFSLISYDTEQFLQSIIASLPASADCLEIYAKA